MFFLILQLNILEPCFILFFQVTVFVSGVDITAKKGQNELS